MKSRLDEIIAAHGLKHWAVAAKKDADFIRWVEEQTTDIKEVTFAERVYAAVSGTSPICGRGKKRSLNTITEGWRFCGRGRACECASESRSTKSKAAWAIKDDETISAINERRSQTLNERYGVTNSGQLEQAKTAHGAFYADAEKVNAATSNGRTTMLERYGVDNALKLPSVQEHRKNFRATNEQKAQASAKRSAKAKEGHYLGWGYDRVVERLTEAGIQIMTTKEAYRGTAKLHYYDFACSVCGLEFRDYIKDGHTPRCPRCHPVEPSWVSRGEDEVAEFIAQNDSVIRNTRKIINPFEIDIVVPDKKLAVEYCGLYWHSELAGEKGRNYHLEKLKACEQAGYRLITIFEDEWLNKADIVRSRIRHAIGQTGETIFARKTKVGVITADEANTFLTQHHIQGAVVGATVHFGLYYDNRLVSVMTFGDLRRNNNAVRQSGHYELYRFASNGNVVGGASKLFQAFIRAHDPELVVSYCDRRWGQGKVYMALGFVLDGETLPGYWWLTDRYRTRNHRFNFTKHKLVEAGHDPAKSEVQIMRELGHDRIWDCGNYKFVWRP